MAECENSTNKPQETRIVIKTLPLITSEFTLLVQLIEEVEKALPNIEFNYEEFMYDCRILHLRIPFQDNQPQTNNLEGIEVEVKYNKKTKKFQIEFQAKLYSCKRTYESQQHFKSQMEDAFRQHVRYGRKYKPYDVFGFGIMEAAETSSPVEIIQFLTFVCNELMCRMQPIYIPTKYIGPCGDDEYNVLLKSVQFVQAIVYSPSRIQLRRSNEEDDAFLSSSPSNSSNKKIECFIKKFHFVKHITTSSDGNGDYFARNPKLWWKRNKRHHELGIYGWKDVISDNDYSLPEFIPMAEECKSAALQNFLRKRVFDNTHLQVKTIKQYIAKLGHEDEKYFEKMTKYTQNQDVIKQIQLANAYVTKIWMVGKKDSGVIMKEEKTTPKFKNKRKFSFYATCGFSIFNTLCEKALPKYQQLDTVAKRSYIRTQLTTAATLGHLQSIVTLLSEKWGKHQYSYGFAQAIELCVSHGFKEADYLFGCSLIHGTCNRKDLFYKGVIYLISCKSLVTVSCLDEINQRLEKEKNQNITFAEYIEQRQRETTLGGIIWKSCILQFNIAVIGDNEVVFHSREQLKRIQKQFQKKGMTYNYSGKSVPFCADIPKLKVDEEKMQQLITKFNVRVVGAWEQRFAKITIFENTNEMIGTIKMNTISQKIVQTVICEELQYLIDFLKTALVLTGCPISTTSWLKQ